MNKTELKEKIIKLGFIPFDSEMTDEIIYRKNAVGIAFEKGNYKTFKIFTKKDYHSLVKIQFKNVETIFINREKTHVILRLWAIDYQFKL